MSILQTTELKKYYGAEPNITRALDGVTLSIEKGEFVAIVGTSGSGKSTLLNMIGGLDVPTSGQVVVDGKELSKLKDEELTVFRRRKIGFIFQNYNLVPVLNVFENIVLPVELDGNKVDKKFMNEVVQMLGLEDKLNNMPNNLSGGQQQRVAIARALVSKPAIVLADEPTGNLDSKTSADVLGLLKTTSQKFHQTLVMITHNSEIAQLADRIIRIEDGKIVGVLFMFCGYLLIYNVFEIAVTNDIRQYGLLRTVGTTSKQIKRLVNRQALYLFLIGTLLGLIFGTLLGRSILPAALRIFAVDYSGGNIEVGTLPYLGIIAGAILFSGLTVYISTRKSVKKASRVSPIEAIRYVEKDTVSIKRKKIDAGAVIPRMAKANLQRNKRRTVFIVISLTLSIVLLNSVFIFSGSFDEDAYIEKHTRSDFMVYSPGIQAAFGNDFGHNSAVPEKAVEEIKAQPGVTNEAYLYRNTFEDDHVSCDWGTPYVVDNTNKEQRMVPEHRT